MTKYKCLNCGWEGEDITEWEEHPKDEFWYKCPKCHHTDEYIQVQDGKDWVPAVVYREPTSEEIESNKRAYQNLSELMKANNVFLESVCKVQKGE